MKVQQCVRFGHYLVERPQLFILKFFERPSLVEEAIQQEGRE